MDNQIFTVIITSAKGWCWPTEENERYWDMKKS